MLRGYADFFRADSFADDFFDPDFFADDFFDVDFFAEDFFDADFFAEDFFDDADFFDADFFDADFFAEDFFDAPFFAGTFAPARRASDSPIAIACLRLVTFLPEPPLRSFPSLRSCITFLTFDCAFFPYFAMSLLLVVTDGASRNRRCASAASRMRRLEARTSRRHRAGRLARPVSAQRSNPGRIRTTVAPLRTREPDLSGARLPS